MMNKVLLTIVANAMVFSSFALAQPQQQTPSQVAIQITSIIGQWAQAIEALQKQNTDLQHQLDTVTKERDELKSKQEPAKK